MSELAREKARGCFGGKGRTEEERFFSRTRYEKTHIHGEPFWSWIQSQGIIWRARKVRKTG